MWPHFTTRGRMLQNVGACFKFQMNELEEVLQSHILWITWTIYTVKKSQINLQTVKFLKNMPIQLSN